MARSPFIRIPYSVPGASAYPVAPADIAAGIDLGYDPDLDAHWVFSDLTSLADRAAGSALVRSLHGAVSGGAGYPASSETTLVFSGGTGSGAAGYAVINSSGAPTEIVITNHGSYTVAPSAAITTAGGGSGAAVTITLGAAPDFTNGWLKLNTGANGLATPFSDSAENTVFGIIKSISSTPSNSGSFVFDNGTNIDLTRGACMFRNASLNYRANTAGITNVDVPAPGAAGNWLFVAMTHSVGAGRAVYWGGGSTYVAPGTKAMRPTPPRVGFGLVNFAQADFGYQLEMLESGYAGRALSATQVASVYARAKARQASLGRTVI